MTSRRMKKYNIQPHMRHSVPTYQHNFDTIQQNHSQRSVFISLFFFIEYLMMVILNKQNNFVLTKVLSLGMNSKFCYTHKRKSYTGYFRFFSLPDSTHMVEAMRVVYRECCSSGGITCSYRSLIRLMGSVNKDRSIRG